MRQIGVFCVVVLVVFCENVVKFEDDYKKVKILVGDFQLFFN